MIVNAEVDSMGENIDGGVEISSAPSPQQSSDLERTQAKLRETSNAAEKYRKELEFLQKGGDPLDLKLGNAATASLQSTSQFVTSEVKGSFAVTASPHGDSVESSGRLGAPSANEPNSADNLMLFDGNKNKNNNDNTTQADVALEIPKKAYKRRVRSRPNRDGPRAHKNLASNSCSDVKVNGIQTQKSTLGQSLTSDEPGSVGHVEHENIDTQTGSNRTLKGQINDCKSGEPLVKKGFESKSTCSQTKDENELVDSIRSGNSNGNMELNLASKETPNLEGSNVNSVKDDKILKNVDDNSITCPTSNNENGSILKEEEGFSAEQNACSQNNLAIKEHEESILEKARIIEEKRKKIAGLSSVVNFASENNHRSHWHFVLEEMSWLANDFAQERIWKATAAAQISSRAAYNSRVRLKQQNLIWKQKEVASSLAEAVMKFWHTLQVGLEFDGPNKDSQNGLHQYGLKFLEYNKSSHVQYSLAQPPKTPDRISDFGIIDILWDDNLTEEKLFYTVPPGAIEAYRNSIESHLLQIKKTGCSMQEVVDATEYDGADDIFEDEEGETNTYYLPGAFEGSRSTKPTQKKRKHFRPNGPKSHETGLGPQQLSVLSGKRPANSINGSIPTKRIRTGSRPRFSGNSGFIHGANRADASSGDTNSFQDEQSLFLHVPNNNMEAESVGDYEKQLQFDLSDGSNRPKKKKKTKHPHPGSLFENRWQLDSSFQNDQKDHSKRRLDARQFDSNGNSVASQTSNMSNSNKFIKLLVRDRGRKSKSLKSPVGQQGSGTPWALFEDQALVVLVHDLGANWELISDALNSLLHLKCISRNSKECKERHKILMDTNGDSAEDSGSSQPYPSTLPNIPEGSARQLFQRLQGPMEEETLKSHFEKIIMISQKQHYRKAQKDNHDPKQLQQPHVSHADALSEIRPNNLIGGHVLTPLDLCDTISPSPDFVPVGHHTGGLPISNHVTAPMAPGSSATATAPISPVRDGRYGIPRVSVEDQHRMNQMSARNMQQPPTDRGARINRNIGMTRPAFQGINHPQSPGVRPHIMRPNQNMRPDLQMPHHPPHAGMHFIKERQIHQQRLLQQQFATSNPIVPPVQPVSSPQSSTQIQNLKQLPRQQLPPPPPGRTGGGKGSGPLMNGFSGSQSVSQQKRYPGQPGQPQTTSLKQLQTDSNNHAPSVTSTTTSSNHRQPQKLVGQSQSQSQATTGQSKVQPFDDSSGAVSSGQGVKKQGESVNSVQWQQQPSS